MPQLPNSSTEDLGADDEVKEYKQEDGEDSENGAHLDLVNDIKSDLIKKETENSEVSNPSYFLTLLPIHVESDIIVSPKLVDFYCGSRFGLGASDLVVGSDCLKAASSKCRIQNHIVWENSK